MPAVSGRVMDEMPATTPTVVDAHPVRSARIAVPIAAVVLVAFTIIAIILKHTVDGANFTTVDQFGIAGVGVLIAVGILLFLRPRMHADASGVDTRGFMGPYRHIDWDLVTAVEFPPKVRFARLVLPGDELVTLYAVQRGDRELSVTVMQKLRALHAAQPPTT
jgi:hypothetical protein